MIKIKICGITNSDDAVCACEHGADMLGFIFAESKRRIDVSKVVSILDVLAKKNLLHSIETSAVFVNESANIMGRTMKETGITHAQIHGDETSSFCNALPFSWYKAFRIKDRISAETASAEMLKYHCSLVLADALSAAGYGGTGERIDTETAVYFRDAVKQSGRRFFLAGGINDKNAAEIIEQIRPDGIDISSGLEESPGRKSRDKIQNLFTNVQKMYHKNSGEYYV